MSESSAKEQADALRVLTDLIAILRAECPWDSRQTLKSLKNKIIEESYELVDAIENNDAESIEEEIGDVLFLALFFAQLFRDERNVTQTTLIKKTVQKYRDKHPHVFKDKNLPDQDAVLRYWHESKDDMFAGIPRSLPALLSAETIQERVSKVGFDWDSHQGPLDKVKEELKEIEGEQNIDRLTEEFGDLLFACVNLARHLNVDPEDALRAANRKFISRFRKIQEELKKRGVKLSDAGLQEMDAIWDEIKYQEKS
jgi:XTP/dITP diphosphohydrolase